MRVPFQKLTAIYRSSAKKGTSKNNNTRTTPTRVETKRSASELQDNKQNHKESYKRQIKILELTRHI